MKIKFFLWILALACMASQWSAAQTFPVKPMRLILPLAAGTGTDQVVRVLAKALTEDLGQSVVIENRPGAGATIGTEAAALAAPDGYTLYVGGSVSLTISPALYKKVPYDPVKDFVAISLISRFYLALSAHPSLPAKNTSELIALARKRPGDMVIASGGTGTASHLTGALFQNMGKINLLHVPYKGGGDSLVAIMSGEAQLAFTPVSLGQRYSKAGKLRLMGVSSPKRIEALPNLPTIAETIPGFEWSGWQVLMVPTGTPQPIVARLRAATQKAINAREFRNYLDREGSEPFQLAPDKFPDFLRAEIAKNANLVKISGARVD